MNTNPDDLGNVPAIAVIALETVEQVLSIPPIMVDELDAFLNRKFPPDHITVVDNDEYKAVTACRYWIQYHRAMQDLLGGL